jgi:hypothetical protein
MLSVLRLCSVVDMINEYGTVGGMELVGETKVLGENPTLCHFVHHKFHIKPGWWKAGYSQPELLNRHSGLLHVNTIYVT